MTDIIWMIVTCAILINYPRFVRLLVRGLHRHFDRVFAEEEAEFFKKMDKDILAKLPLHKHQDYKDKCKIWDKEAEEM